MAARSPIVLESSPPDAFRILSVTPQTTRKKSSSSVTDSSSPFPEASSFYTRPAACLKSGSRAQQPPPGAVTGFASAAALLKTQALNETKERPEEPVGHVRDGAAGTARPKEKAGKLRRPSKKTGTATHPQTSASPLQSFAYQEPAASPHSKGRLSVPPSPLLRHAESGDGSLKTKDRSVSVSKLDLRSNAAAPLDVPKKSVKKARKPRAKKADVVSEDHTTKQGDDGREGNAAKVPRKRTAKAIKPSTEAPSKRPKKRFTKSESIILNSDEPDSIPAVQATEAVEERGTLEKRRDTVLDIPILPEGGHAITTTKSTELSGYGLPRQLSESIRCQQDDAVSTHFDQSVSSPPASARGFRAPHIHIGATQDLSLPPREAATGHTTLSPELPETLLAEKKSSLATEVSPTKSLPALISGLGYSESRAGQDSPGRTCTGEAFTKRRRVDLADASAMGPPMRKVRIAAPDQPTKVTKAPRKKPQTITALATKAYQAPADPNQAQSTVSSFFAPQAAQVEEDAHVERPEVAVKPKRARKPRAKKTDAEGSGEASLKSVKTKKTKPRTKASENMARLYSPEEARVEEKSQGFLFGTSSQLAGDESPTFILQMQMALSESEKTLQSRSAASPECIRVRVASAPYGTNLSVGQANRDLWCTGARDRADDIFSVGPDTRGRKSASSRRLHPTTYDPSEALEHNAIQDNPAPDTLPAPQPLTAQPRDASFDMNVTDSKQDHDVIDLCNTSPIRDHYNGPRLTNDVPEHFSPVQINEVGTQETQNGEQGDHPLSDDSWMLLRSDDSNPRTTEIPRPNDKDPSGLTISKTPSLKRSTTSPLRERTVLQNLDANINVVAHISSAKGSGPARAFSIATQAAPSKRPRGRPSKDVLFRDPLPPASPKPRGRPLRKIGAPSDMNLEASVSRPAASSGLIDPDEIHDPELPLTPSPPRRRAHSSPPAIQPLELEIVVSPTQKAAVLLTATTILKPTDSEWQSIMTDLFPRITKTVKSTPPGSDLDCPTWHEKILLYDPIVLEDLTAWLHQQGLRLQRQIAKPKAKKRGRKPKDVPSEEPGYEMCTEDLKAWMVQKWCEENSICCLWKEGLRGGVRTRY